MSDSNSGQAWPVDFISRLESLRESFVASLPEAAAAEFREVWSSGIQSIDCQPGDDGEFRVCVSVTTADRGLEPVLVVRLDRLGYRWTGAGFEALS